MSGAPWPPFPLPAPVLLGLATAAGEVVAGVNGYLRLPAWLDAIGPAAIGNDDTVVWPRAAQDWGTITAVLVFDPTGRDSLVTLACPPIAIDRYARARISFGGLQITPGSVPVGYGRLSFGRGGFGSARSASYQSVNYGLEGFGRYGFGTKPVLAGSAVVSLTFERVALCSPGSWTEVGCPFARAA